MKKNFKVAGSKMTSAQKSEAMKLARALCAKRPKGNPAGFATLKGMERLDLTVEVFVLDKRWSEWFAADIKKIAVDRLSEAGCAEPQPKYLWNRKSPKLSRGTLV